MSTIGDMLATMQDIEQRDWRYYREIAEKALRDAHMADGYGSMSEPESLARDIKKQVNLAVEQIKENID